MVHREEQEEQTRPSLLLCMQNRISKTLLTLLILLNYVNAHPPPLALIITFRCLSEQLITLIKRISWPLDFNNYIGFHELSGETAARCFEWTPKQDDTRHLRSVSRISEIRYKLRAVRRKEIRLIRLILEESSEQSSSELFLRTSESSNLYSSFASMSTVSKGAPRKGNETCPGLTDHCPFLKCQASLRAERRALFTCRT